MKIAEAYYAVITVVCRARVFSAERGRFGVGPRNTLASDSICIPDNGYITIKTKRNLMSMLLLAKHVLV